MEGLEFFQVLFLKLIFNESVIALLCWSNSCYSVLYGCRTLSVTLREEMIFESTMLSRIWGPRREEVISEQKIV